MLFFISGSQSVLLSSGIEIGIAVNLKKNKEVCYDYGWFRRLEDIPGKANISFGSVEMPNTEIGVSSAGVNNAHNEYIGTLGARGLGVGLSPLLFDIDGASCTTPKDRIINFTPLL